VPKLREEVFERELQISAGVHAAPQHSGKSTARVGRIAPLARVDFSEPCRANNRTGSARFQVTDASVGLRPATRESRSPVMVAR
jgi:hypothetical protein